LVIGAWTLVISVVEAVLVSKSPSVWLPILALAAALVVWASLFALGAYLEWGADQPRHDLRKPLIILATMASFLAIWGLALAIRTWRMRRK
jgi:hypothetical protein